MTLDNTNHLAWLLMFDLSLQYFHHHTIVMRRPIKCNCSTYMCNSGCMLIIGRVMMKVDHFHNIAYSVKRETCIPLTHSNNLAVANAVKMVSE